MQLLEYMRAKSSLAVMLVFLALQATPFWYFFLGLLCLENTLLGKENYKAFQLARSWRFYI